jgi:large conductance mechanosensitive channel
VKNVLEDFKKFIMKGNVIDLAVAVIIGIAFGAVIDSVVNDLIMPVVGAVFGQTSFDQLTLDIGDGVVRYGAFLTEVFNFLVIAASLFLIIKAFEKMQSLRGSKKEAEALTVEGELLTEIRDLLKSRST